MKERPTTTRTITTQTWNKNKEGPNNDRTRIGTRNAKGSPWGDPHSETHRTRIWIPTEESKPDVAEDTTGHSPERQHHPDGNGRRNQVNPDLADGTPTPKNKLKPETPNSPDPSRPGHPNRTTEYPNSQPDSPGLHEFMRPNGRNGMEWNGGGWRMNEGMAGQWINGWKERMDEDAQWKRTEEQRIENGSGELEE
ncbi:hypothetical protein quinque_012097 [Culex quinquefasciatus]